MTNIYRPQAPIRRATLAEASVVAQLVAVAFAPLGMSRWLVPTYEARSWVLPSYFRILIEHAMVHGHVDATTDGAGAAVWLPVPGPEVPDYDRRLELACGHHAERFRALDTAMHTSHPTGRAHEHLLFLAVHPHRQGHGKGCALLWYHHMMLDAQHTPAYLEAASADSARLYTRHGYLPIGEPFAPPGCDAPMQPMWREADPLPPSSPSAAGVTPTPVAWADTDLPSANPPCINPIRSGTGCLYRP